MGRDLAAGGSGTRVCRDLSRVYDDIVSRLWHEAIVEVHGADECSFALVATGGWGRQELCPYSDIDFIILAQEKYEDIARELADKILYPLWDLKAKVGHAVRSSAEAARLAREDLPTATALLDARLVVGSPQSFQELFHATKRSVAPGGNANHFVGLLRLEQTRRHERFGDSLYLLEPNIKQGIGGLRDFSTAHWAARARWSVPGLFALVERGELTRRQAEVMRKGLEFILKIRCLVQLEAGRGTDQLSFELQEIIGPALFPFVAPPEGRIVPAVAPAVETLMRKYYLAGRGIERITSRILESATVPERRKPRTDKIDRSFLRWNGKLAVSDPAVFREDPSEMLRYFRVARTEGLPLYGHTQELIEAEVAKSGHLLHGNAKASRYFLEALTDLEDKGPKTLFSQMHEVGLLAAVMPEFGPCTGRVQHDLYHVYTVDHHQIFTVELLKRTGRGELGPSGDLAETAYQRVKRLEPLFLGTLLHDVGKPLGGGHAETGAQIGARTATSLGMNDSDVATVDFLVRQHLSMTHISQRRDLSDPDVIEKFAELVGTSERLTQLYLLTRCDTAMTAPGNLSSWKDELLGELYTRTLESLEGGREMESDQALHRRQARQRAVEIASEQGRDPVRAARAEAVVDKLDPAFVNSLSARQLSRVVTCELGRVDENAAVAVMHRSIAARGQSEFVCAAEDSDAGLSHVAGVLAAHRVRIDSATVTSFTDAQGDWVAAQVFFVRDEFEQLIPNDDRRWAGIERDLKATFAAENRNAFVEELLGKRDEGYSVKPEISTREDTQIKIFDGESTDYSVIEVHTTDDVGLLHTITKTLAEQGLDIYRSMLSTEGDRIADVFYVKKKADGSKITPMEGVELSRVIQAAVGGLE
jgi:[protein-PII] uridylyltransferase